LILAEVTQCRHESIDGGVDAGVGISAKEFAVAWDEAVDFHLRTAVSWHGATGDWATESLEAIRVHMADEAFESLVAQVISAELRNSLIRALG
jgi:hypothetical protein